MSCTLGSPPRVRGTDFFPPTEIFTSRITPARAGNSASVPGQSFRHRDHPRACGEQSGSGGGAVVPGGSPPRVRGTARPMQCMRTGKGITPARAGNSEAAGLQWQDVEDHPRACGEQPRAAAAETVLSGSPPRVRGTAESFPFAPRGRRITPARAGNSFARALSAAAA